MAHVEVSDWNGNLSLPELKLGDVMKNAPIGHLTFCDYIYIHDYTYDIYIYIYVHMYSMYVYYMCTFFK
jgi:hypothetical protein